MKNLKTILTASALATATMLSSCGGGTCDKAPEAKFNNAADSASYAIGILMGTQIHEQIMPDLEGFNYNNLIAGFNASVNDTSQMKFKPMEAQQILMKIMQQLSEAKAQKTLEEGKKFLEENAKKEGVKVIDSTGVQYLVLEEGNGAQPTIDDQVECDYVGTLIDGTEFDSSIKRGQPATFPLKGVIPGWSKTIPLMKVGSKWRIFIPSELGYGPRGTGNIPGNSVLIFDVTLHQIIKQDKKK